MQHFPWPAWAHAPGAGESWSLVIRGAQHGQIGFRTAANEQGHTWEQELQLWPQSTCTLEQGDLGSGHDVLPRTCRLTKRLKSTGQYENMNMEAITADDLMLSWSLVSYMTSRKVLGADG